MNKLIVAAATLAMVVVGLVLFTALDSSAQETDGTEESSTTTTTVAGEDPAEHEGFGFGFWGDRSAAIEEFRACLEEQGVEIPDEQDRGFFFELDSEDFENLGEALEACDLPLPQFAERFDGELPEDFPFELPEDLLDELPEGFPFGEGFSFDELPDGFPFGGRFEFGGPLGLDRDELAACLAELGSFNSVDDVRAKLDECLPDEPSLRFERGPRGFHFGFDGFFDSQLEESPEPESASL